LKPRTLATAQEDLTRAFDETWTSIEDEWPELVHKLALKKAAGLKPPSFNAPNIVVAEADDAARLQTIDFKRRRTVYKSLYAPFISLLGRHHVDDDHTELLVQAHLVTLCENTVFLRCDWMAPRLRLIFRTFRACRTLDILPYAICSRVSTFETRGCKVQ
jgi:hypothetical protein